MIGYLKLCNDKGQKEKNPIAWIIFQLLSFSIYGLGGRKFYVNLDTWLTK